MYTNNEKIELVFLPPYSPKLNPIEKLWKTLKQRSMQGRYFKSKEDFYIALRKGLKAINESTSSCISVMSKWLEIYTFIETKLISKDLRWKHVTSLFDQPFA